MKNQKLNNISKEIFDFKSKHKPWSYRNSQMDSLKKATLKFYERFVLCCDHKNISKLWNFSKKSFRIYSIKPV